MYDGDIYKKHRDQTALDAYILNDKSIEISDLATYK
jgi:hypothetical protein